MRLRSWASALLFAGVACRAGQTEDFVRQAGAIAAGGAMTFAAQVGDGAMLRYEGYALGTNRAIRVTYDEKEILRAVDGSLFLQLQPTAGIVRVDIPFPLHVVAGYNPARDISLGLSAMPPADPRPFAILNYAGLPARTTGLPDEPLPDGGVRYIDDLEKGKCIEVYATSNRASVTFVQPSASGSLLLHEVRLSPGVTTNFDRLQPARTVVLTNFVSVLSFLSRASSTLLRVPLQGASREEAVNALGNLLRMAEGDTTEFMPPLPPPLRRGLPPPVPTAPEKR